MAYKNPTPVVVGLVFPKPQELLLVRRSIASYKGELALPGGYVISGEGWRDALAREISEEATVSVSTDPKHMKVFDVRSTPDGKKPFFIHEVVRGFLPPTCPYSYHF
jgi:ADP-ribose pyrophosphatase YjhB (NUDIX family)